MLNFLYEAMILFLGICMFIGVTVIAHSLLCAIQESFFPDKNLQEFDNDKMVFQDDPNEQGEVQKKDLDLPDYIELIEIFMSKNHFDEELNMQIDMLYKTLCHTLQMLQYTTNRIDDYERVYDLYLPKIIKALETMEFLSHNFKTQKYQETKRSLINLIKQFINYNLQMNFKISDEKELDLMSDIEALQASLKQKEYIDGR